MTSKVKYILDPVLIVWSGTTVASLHQSCDTNGVAVIPIPSKCTTRIPCIFRCCKWIRESAIVYIKGRRRKRCSKCLSLVPIVIAFVIRPRFCGFYHFLFLFFFLFFIFFFIIPFSSVFLYCIECVLHLRLHSTLPKMQCLALDSFHVLQVDSNELIEWFFFFKNLFHFLSGVRYYWGF